MERPPKLGPKAGVLRIGEIIAWIKSRFREPPEHLSSTNPAQEATKPATAGPQSFLSELAAREFIDPRVQDWIDQQYRRAIAPPPTPAGEIIGTEAVTEPGEARVTAEVDIQEESYECPSCGKRILRRQRGDGWRLFLFGVVWVASFLATTLLAWFFFDFLLGGFLEWLEHGHPVLYGLFGLSVVGVSWWVAKTFWDGLEPQLDAWGERRERRRKLSLEEVLYPRLDKPKIEPKAPSRPN